jgi:hypothetical protein
MGRRVEASDAGLPKVPRELYDLAAPDGGPRYTARDYMTATEPDQVIPPEIEERTGRGHRMMHEYSREMKRFAATWPAELQFRRRGTKIIFENDRDFQTYVLTREELL